MVVDVIIPAYNEEEAVGLVVNDVPRELVRNIIVVNNASSDGTSAMARSSGAIVVDQPERGYGNACLMGMEYIRSDHTAPDVIVFLDADHSDHPEQMPALLAPIEKDEADLIIGSRTLGNRERGSMMPQQILGNWIATRLMEFLYGVRFTDLGPFRAIRWDALMSLDMKDRTYGWTVEMQVKAAKSGMRVAEVPVDYRVRKGVSKVSGTVTGSVLAGYKIISTLIKYR